MPMKSILISLLFFLFFKGFAQEPVTGPEKREQVISLDTTQKPPITSYKIISARGVTTFVDTTMAIYKDYRFNYLRKDNFELLPFANVGQTYTSLGYNFKGEQLLPDIGARARHFHFLDAGDIKYYEVPTPLTELYFKTVPEQGQTLDAFFTINTSPRLNFSIAYKGLRSLGNYQNALTSTGHFRSTVSYSTLNNRYKMKAHFVSQDLLNRENGGLNELAMEQYLLKEENFEDRAILEVKFENAENVLFGKRFYMDHGFDLVQSTYGFVGLNHRIDFSDKKYIYRQDSPFAGFGEALRNSNLNDEVRLRNINNVVSLSLQNNNLGHLVVKGGHTYYNYGYNSIIFIGDQAVTNRLRGQNYSAGAQYSHDLGRVSVYGDAMVNLAGDFSAHFLTAGVEYRLNPQNIVNIEINSNERAPNFNFLLYQSDYLNYNWQNDFDNEVSRVLSARLTSPFLASIEASLTQVDNYTYFGNPGNNGIKPLQYDGTLNYLKIKAHREFTYGKFSLDNTLMYQKVTEGAYVLNVPEFVTRNSFYYSDHWFRRALFLQTGFTLKYFTAYNMDAYDPVLAEFYVQNETELGNYPVVDFFFNGKIRQTRIFFKLEHINSLLTGNNNFSAPEYPYRDFMIRFGLVWNFFL